MLFPIIGAKVSNSCSVLESNFPFEFFGSMLYWKNDKDLYVVSDYFFYFKSLHCS